MEFHSIICVIQFVYFILIECEIKYYSQKRKQDYPKIIWMNVLIQQIIQYVDI